MANIHSVDFEDRELDVKMGARQKKMTGKGFEYTIPMKRKLLDNPCRGLKTNMDYIDNLISVDEETLCRMDVII